MEAEPLTRACELVFAVALQGAEADPPIEAPPSMRSFLYLPQLPRRALTVARRAVEDDPAFRARVAAQATIDNVGRTGYLWLHQMPGWEQEVHTASSGDDATAVPPVPRPPMPPGPVSVGATPPPPTPPPSPPSTAGAPGRTPDSIEEELASLRSLVGRLSEERESTNRELAMSPTATVSPLPSAPSAEPSSVAPAAAPAPPASAPPTSTSSSVPGDLADLNERLRTTNERLSEAYARLNTNGQELDEAKRAASEYAVARDRALADREALLAAQAKLEVELAELRQKVNEAERSIDREATARAAAERIGADVGAELAEVKAELDVTRAAAAELVEVKAELDTVRAAAQQRQAEAEEVERALQSALDAASEENALLAERVGAAEQARLDLEVELDRVSGQWQAVKVELAQLSDERRALVDRIAAQQRDQEIRAVERRALFDDFAAHLGQVEAERDRLAGEVQHLTTRLDATRTALDAATRSVALEVDAASLALDGVTDAMKGLDGSLDATHERLAGLTPSLSDLGSPGAPGDAHVDRDVDHGAPDIDPLHGQSSADDDHALETVMNTYGFGPEPGGAGEPDTIDLAGAPVENLVESADTGTDTDVDADASTDTDAGTDADGGIGPTTLGGEQPESDDDATWFDRAPTSEATPETPPMPPMPPPEFSSVASLDDADRVAPVTFADALGQGTTTGVDETDLERALQTVTTTDVVILVDGDPTATMGWREHTVYDRRRFLLEKLDQVTAEYGPALNVVFDPEVGGEDDLPASNYVRPWLVQRGVETADALADLIGRYPNHFPIAVVSDDPGLRARLDQRGIQALDVVALLDLIVALPDPD